MGIQYVFDVFSVYDQGGCRTFWGMADQMGVRPFSPAIESNTFPHEVW